MSASRALAALVIAGLGASAGASTCALAPGSTLNQAESLAIHAFGFELFLATLALAGAALAAGPVRERLGLVRGRLPGASIAWLALGTLALSHALDAVIDTAGLGEHGTLAELEAALGGVRGRSLALVALAFGVAPGIAEELLCRGLLQRGLVPALGARAAIAVSALVFGALHVDPVHAGFAALLGLYLGIVAHAAGSVRAAIACHVANNLSAVALAAAAPQLAIPPAASIILGGGFALAALLGATRSRRAPPASAGA